jgi:hypothetical protein
MAQLVRVDDLADRLHDAVSDVEREHVGQAAVGVEADRTGLPVDLRAANVDAELLHLLAEPAEQLGDALAAVDRARPRRRLAAPSP